MNINIKTLNHYVENATIPIDVLRDSVKNIDLFMSGKKQPTFNQISSIAKKLNIPTGLLLLDKAIEVKSNRLEFRTLNSSHISRISEELRDTIIEMEAKQAFLRDEIEFTLDFIGSCSIEENAVSVASRIREKIQITEDFQRPIPKEKILNFLTEKINNIGVFVFFNGKVGDNTTRPLSLDEFRGFVLTDDKAPIIFINQKDETKNGKLFTLIHELVHLFIGTDEILTEIDAGDYTFDKTEAFVNKVTAEILVPKNIFKKEAVEQLQSGQIDEQTRILSGIFKVSEFVIVRRLYDMNFISKRTYEEKTKQLKNQFDQFRKNKAKSSGGGDYYNNLSFRIDKRFFGYVQQALQQNRISYTDAFSIIGVGYKGYKYLAEGK
ncbi:ImmA/IrrE family metallo-endopeptidase [Lonepinella sp. BR2930]|uniref:ImmA/IrrE family metallo-endopeptidase n=1 Tax=Lonepinella sp. BR2930 TaxID=3434554 RepID=UPI003F6DD871